MEKALQVQSKYNTYMVMEFTFISMSLEILNTNNDYQKIVCLVYSSYLITYFILIAFIERDKEGHVLMMCPYPSCNTIVRFDRPHKHALEESKNE